MLHSVRLGPQRRCHSIHKHVHRVAIRCSVAAPNLPARPLADSAPAEEALQQDATPAATAAADDGELFPVLQLQLPTPTHTKVKTAVYLTSCVKHQDCPAPKYPEFAVIGRSNVGKSSLINMMTNCRKLAHVSKEPGAHGKQAALTRMRRCKSAGSTGAHSAHVKCMVMLGHAVQAKRVASTTFSSTTAGTWWTCQATGE